MPQCDNFRVDFSTTSTSDKRLYPFKTSDAAPTPPVELGRFNAYHGSYSDAGVHVTPGVIPTVYHGLYANLDLQAYITFDADARHGVYVDTDLTDNPVKTFDVDVYYGSRGDTDLSTFLVILNVDARQGVYSDLDLTDNPAKTFDANAYSGARSDTDLSTIAVMDSNARHGVYADTDLTDNPVKTFDVDVYYGSRGDTDLFATVVIHETNSYHGSYSDLDFTNNPVDELDAAAYHGSYSDVGVHVTPGFIPTVYHGLYANLDFTIILGQGFGDGDAYHGSYADLEIAPTYNLPSVTRHGLYADINLATTVNFGETVAYHGTVLNFDLELSPPATLPATAYFGSWSNVDAFSVTKSLFPRGYTGAYVSCDFTNNPPDELEQNVYHGAYAVLNTLDSDTFIFRAYAGEYSGVTMNVTLAIGAFVYHGSTTKFNDLNIAFVSLPASAYHGSNGLIPGIGFEVPGGADITANAYHGQTLTTETNIKIHQTLKATAYHGYAMYDGFGGVGGLNHCISTNLDSHYGDTAIRFDFPVNGNFDEYDDQLNIYFDETGFLPWNPCNKNHGTGHLEVDLLTNQRFQANVYTGENTKVFIEKELTGFSDDIPDAILYAENGQGNRHDHVDVSDYQRELETQLSTGSFSEIWWEDPETVLGFHSHSVQLEIVETPIWQDIGNGEEIYLDLSAEKPSWFNCIGEFSYDSQVRVNFNPEIWLRFCPGYVLPVGTSVVFEFGQEENHDCFGYFSAHGSAVNFSLSATPHPQTMSYFGGTGFCTLTINAPWLLKGYHGSNVQVKLSTEDTLPIHGMNHGSFAISELYEQPILGYSGANVSIDTIEVSVGFSVEWITPAGCLSNEYVPKTAGGDPDLPALEADEHGVHKYFNVPVENHIYFKPVTAVCITYVDKGTG